MDVEMAENSELPQVEDRIHRNVVSVPRSKIYRMKVKIKVTVPGRKMGSQCSFPKVKRTKVATKKKHVRFSEEVQVFYIPARGEED